MALLLTASPVTRMWRLHRGRVRAASPAFIWCPEFAHWRRLAQPLVGVERNPSRRLPSLHRPYRWRGWSRAGEAGRRSGTAGAGRRYGCRKRGSLRMAGAVPALKGWASSWALAAPAALDGSAPFLLPERCSLKGKRGSFAACLIPCRTEMPSGSAVPLALRK